MSGGRPRNLASRRSSFPRSLPVFCAFGDTVADLRISEARTHIAAINGVDVDALNDIFNDMELRARRRLSGQSIARNYDTRRSIDMHYTGEVHEVTVPVRSRTRRITRLNLEATVADFHTLHERLFAHKNAAQSVEILTLRLDLIGIRDKPRLFAAEFGEEDPAAALKVRRAVHFDVEATLAPIYDGNRLRPGHFIQGPAIIEQWGTTVAVLAGHECLVDAYGNLIIEVGQVSAATERHAG